MATQEKLRATPGSAIRCCCFLFVVCIIASGGAFAQDTTIIKNNKWSFLLEPYFMFPNMRGTVGLGQLPDAEVDQGTGDIFKHLQFGAMLYAEAYKGSWTISSDFTYMKLSGDATGKRGVLSGSVNIKQLAWELAGLRKIKPWLEAGIGLQLNNIESDANLVVTTPGGTSMGSRSLSKTWVDPSIIARVELPLSQKWFFQFRGNIGGFGIGSNLYWQLQAYFGYHFSKLFQLSAGYRVIDLDYDKGSDADRFKYDMTTFGPVVRLGFNF